jgi:hypothetical protein
MSVPPVPPAPPPALQSVFARHWTHWLVAVSQCRARVVMQSVSARQPGTHVCVVWLQTSVGAPGCGFCTAQLSFVKQRTHWPFVSQYGVVLGQSPLV